MKTLLNLGHLILHGIKIQAYFIARLVTGGILFGFFPALFGSYRILTKSIEDKVIYDFNFKNELKYFDKKEVVEINKIGYLYGVYLYVVVTSLNFSRGHIGIRPIHWLLVTILLVAIASFIYTISIYTKYNLTIKQYVYQGFLCSITGIFETIAIFLGMSIMLGLSLTLPVVGVFVSVPLMILPHAWFGRTAVLRFVSVFYKVDEADKADK